MFILVFFVSVSDSVSAYGLVMVRASWSRVYERGILLLFVSLLFVPLLFVSLLLLLGSKVTRSRVVMSMGVLLLTW